MITLSDFFCGAGGSSTGAIQVPGVTVRLAANHWQLAVDTHQANHQDALHDTADLSQVDPRRYPTTDIAWLSPSCTNHSIAKGVARSLQQPDLFGETLPDQAAERSRATMWDVIRFAEHHRYRAIVVENVVDAREWVLWPAWSTALSTLGYDFKVVSLNSMHAQALGAGAPQSRDRLYVVAWRRGERAPELDRWTRPTATCPTHGTVSAIQAWKNPAKKVGKYRTQYVWRCPQVECRNTVVEPAVRPASDAIDWDLPAQRIGDRAKPLAEKTMKRIRDGFAAYARPLLVPAGGTWNDTAYPVDHPMRTRTTRETEGVAFPDLIAPYYGTSQARPASEPLPTVTTVERHALLRGGEVSGVEDVRFRMLAVHEYAAAMAFPSDYVILGTKRERVRMAGNAVTPNAARDLVAAVVEALTGEQVDRAAPAVEAAA
ncbi:DNA cytosine methyltransferase [Nocardiopsis synnemataformans]|uniref:DNA cytosine methyltransferase n=1 Tax=Nocardiopsis synnemataformans TaxID=61305 RepID=UPI003EB9896C